MIKKFLKNIFLACLLLGGSGLLQQFQSTAKGENAPQGIRPGAPLRFEHITVEDGLPSATVLSVLQDQDGFMWFATEDGLARYDGMEFKIFQHIPGQNSLSANNVFCLIQSQDGLLWVGTDPGGLNVYDPKTGRFSVYRHDPDDENSLLNDSVWSLLEDRDGNIWVGTRAGLSRLDRRTGLFHNYPYDVNNPYGLAGTVIYRIYQDRAGTIWVATRNGLQHYNPDSDTFTTFAHNPEDPHSISNSNVWAMLEDSHGNFWVGTRGGGLNRMDRATGTFQAYRYDPADPTSISSDRIWSIFEDSSGNLWVLTETGGLNLFDPENGTFTRYQHNESDPFSLSHNDVFWMTEDRSGALWITSRYGGVNRLSPMFQRFGLYRTIPGDPRSLPGSNVYTTLKDADGTLWVGTFGGGLAQIDPKTKIVQSFIYAPDDPSSLSNDKVYYIHRDRQQRLWVATAGGGLNLWDPDTSSFIRYQHTENDPTTLETDFITAIQDADDNRLWLGTLGFGLVLFDPQQGKVVKVYKRDLNDPNSLSEDTIYMMVADSRGRLWIATARGGLNFFDPKEETFTHYRHQPDDPNTILSDTVHDVYLDEDNGRVWAATNAGLSMLDLKTGTWKHYTKADGLPTGTLMGLEPGLPGELWISTGRGLSRFNIETETFTNYTAADGLQGNQFNIAAAYRAPDGELFFGGPGGLTHFYPKDIIPNLYAPPVVFTGLEIFNRPVETGSELLPQSIEHTSSITLSYAQSVFTIHFAALNYQIPSGNQYSYKLEGFDIDWSPPRSINQVTYTNLPPGTYTLLVRAANHDGIWNPTPARLEIVITPPWWATWWFRLLTIVTVLGILFGSIQWRFYNIRKTNRELEKRVAERTAALSAAKQELQEVNHALQARLDEITLLQQKVREQSIRDPLTGLHNRRYLDEFLPGAFSRARREQSCIAFVLIDLDHFKSINDNYGHAAGDAVLIRTAQMFQERVREGDLACRYGGEEFLLVLPGLGIEKALERAEEIRQALESLNFQYEGQPISITASIGVSVYPLHGEDHDTLLNAADKVLYEAKASGRNRVILCQNTKP